MWQMLDALTGAVMAEYGDEARAREHQRDLAMMGYFVRIVQAESAISCKSVVDTGVSHG